MKLKNLSKNEQIRWKMQGTGVGVVIWCFFFQKYIQKLFWEIPQTQKFIGKNK